MLEHLRTETGWVWNRCRHRFGSALALSLAFKALNLLLLAPLATVILRYCLMRWGRASVGNFELVSFALSPAGLAALFGAGTVLLASLYLELAGMLRLLADDDLHWWQAFKGSTRLFLRVVHLGLRQLAVYLVLAAPFLAGIAFVYWVFWSGKDLNGLIVLKPAAFWWGVILAGAIAAVYSFLAFYVFLRRVYAVPILTFEPGATAASALKCSVKRSQSTLWRCASTIMSWLVIQSVLAVASVAFLNLVLQSVLRSNASSLSIAALLTGTVLAIHALMATVLSVVVNVTFAAVVLSLYRQVAPGEALRNKAPLARAAAPASLGWILGVVLLAVTVFSATASVFAVRDLKLQDSLEITAHRAGATSAPENTVAALKQAIADGADWAEIDVQLTADKELIIMHDIDLARVGGGSRRVDQVTLAEIRELDVGTPFGQQFAGERIATLSEILAAAADKIRLNVELKPHSKPDGQELTRRVIEEIREAEMVGRCRLCSQSYESLQLARQIEPRLEIGYIVATTVGDPSELDVNFLMVKSTMATRAFVDRAQLRKIAVHAWTVNDPAQVGPLLDAQIANLITDDPSRMRTQLNEIRALTTAQRLLLRARHAIVP